MYFECNIRASPWVTEVRWWFEGKELHTNTSAGVIVSNQSLVLQRVQRRNRGRYTCSGEFALSRHANYANRILPPARLIRQRERE